MGMKTPAQIATEVQQIAPFNANEWEMMVRAIETDRAQLKDALVAIFHVIDRREGVAVQLGIDLGNARGDLSRLAQDLGARL